MDGSGPRRPRVPGGPGGPRATDGRGGNGGRGGGPRDPAPVLAGVRGGGAGADGPAGGVPGAPSDKPVAPPAFTEALLSMRGVRLRPEVVLQEIPAPTRLAPYAAALTAEVTLDAAGMDPDALLGHGRFVLLHDPDGQPAWGGDTRVVVMAKARLEDEMGADPMLGEVGWAWLQDALDGRGCGVHHVTGTVTRVLSETFGGLELQGAATEIEVRASWTPATHDLGPHLGAWADLCSSAAGLEPLPHGVVPLAPRH